MPHLDDDNPGQWTHFAPGRTAMPAHDHPNGGSYETQADRFGSGGHIDMRELSAPYQGGTPRRGVQPKVQAERSFTFKEEDIKIILAQYVEDNYDMKNVDLSNVTADYRQSSGYGQFDHSPGYCNFTVKVRG